DMVREATFRDDLFYRLNVGAIHLPPLRSRTDDIEPLVHHFVGIFNQRLGRTMSGAAPEVFDILARYSWRGNVRELANVIERAMVLLARSPGFPVTARELDYQLGSLELNDIREPHLAIVLLGEDPSPGLAVIEEVHKSAPATQVLAVSTDERSETIVRALRAGA